MTKWPRAIYFVFMAKRLLKRVGLETFVINKLKSANIHTCQDLLSKNIFELQHILNVSLHEVNEIIGKVSQKCCQKSQTVWQLWEKRKEYGCTPFIRTSLAVLDEVLHEGLPTGTLSEIAGPSGCGKTQFSMMLSVNCTLPIESGGLNGSVIYIDTESAFSAERLVEIAENRYPDLFDKEESLVSLTSKVHVSVVSTCSSLLHRLENLEEDIIRDGVKLIVLDSVASLVRKEFDSRSSRNMAERTNVLSRQAALLKYIAETFNIAVVVTNQITTRYGKAAMFEEPQSLASNSTRGVSLEGESSYVTAALGNTWSHCVNTRLILQYLDQQRRQVLIAKSPVSPFANFVYTIQASGIQLEKEGAHHYEGTDPGLQHIRVKTSITDGAILYG